MIFKVTLFADNWVNELLHPDCPDALLNMPEADEEEAVDIVNGRYPAQAYQYDNGRLIFSHQKYGEIQAEIQAGIDAVAQRKEELNSISADEELRVLAAMTAEEIDTYIDATMIGVPLKAQIHFKKLTKMLAVLGQREFG